MFTAVRPSAQWCDPRPSVPPPLQAGSTACVYLLAGDMGCTAHVGDSRAVLCSLAEAVALTADHKPGVNPSERQRLQDAGAVLTQDGYIELGGAEGEVAGVWHDSGGRAD